MNQPQVSDSLAAIYAERDKVLNEIKQQKIRIREDAQALFAPPKANTKMGAMINGFDKAIAIYDGVMLGMRIVRKFRFLFRRKRRY